MGKSLFQTVCILWKGIHVCTENLGLCNESGFKKSVSVAQQIHSGMVSMKERPAWHMRTHGNVCFFLLLLKFCTIWSQPFPVTRVTLTRARYSFLMGRLVISAAYAGPSRMVSVWHKCPLEGCSADYKLSWHSLLAGRQQLQHICYQWWPLRLSQTDSRWKGRTHCMGIQHQPAHFLAFKYDFL